MSKLLTRAFLCGLSVLALGCGGGPDYEGPQRFSISGTVKVDGEPMQWGTISFIPPGESAGKSQRVSGGPIIDGKFEVREGRGANAGEYRVEIRWQKPTGKKIRDFDTEEMIDELAEGLPAKYHEDSELTVNVSAENHVFDFDLASAE